MSRYHGGNWLIFGLKMRIEMVKGIFACRIEIYMGRQRVSDGVSHDLQLIVSHWEISADNEGSFQRDASVFLYRAIHDCQDMNISKLKQRALSCLPFAGSADKSMLTCHIHKISCGEILVELEVVIPIGMRKGEWTLQKAQHTASRLSLYIILRAQFSHKYGPGVWGGIRSTGWFLNKVCRFSTHICFGHHFIVDWWTDSDFAEWIELGPKQWRAKIITLPVILPSLRKNKG
jgi:hypothetical protein